MKKDDLDALLDRQQEYFASGETLFMPSRKYALKKLSAAIDTYEEKLYTALNTDLGKSRSESYMCEIGLVKSEISYMLSHMGKFARERRVRTPLAQFAARSFEKPSPYGCVLIMSPWNYPFLLTMDPLVDAIVPTKSADTL